MKIEFHPEAIKNFNERANGLLLSLIPKAEEKRNIKTFESGIVTEEIFKEDLLSFGPSGEIDYTGRPTSIFFEYQNKNIGLFEKNFTKLLKLAEDIQRTGKLYDLVGVEFIYKTIFDWMKRKYIGKNDKELCGWLIEKFGESINYFEIWVPIAHTIIEEQFEIGIVRFINLSKEILNKWESRLLEIAKDDEHRESIKTLIEKERNDKQGRAVSVVIIEAEKDYASEIAFKKVEEALCVLRLFSPSAYFININSFTTILGRENLEKIECYYISNGCMETHFISLLESTQIDWFIDKTMISLIKNPGLLHLNELLKNNKRNQFQEKILNAIFLFSKSTLMKNVSDKLVYIFTALESILLRNETESIQQNVSERIAFAISQNGAKRMEIVKIVRTAYSLRSKYIHHGLATDEVNILNDFMKIVIDFIFSLINNCNNFNTKDDMITSIEKMKYGAK